MSLFLSRLPILLTALSLTLYAQANSAPYKLTQNRPAEAPEYQTEQTESDKSDESAQENAEPEQEVEVETEVEETAPQTEESEAPGGQDTNGDAEKSDDAPSAEDDEATDEELSEDEENDGDESESDEDDKRPSEETPGSETAETDKEKKPEPSTFFEKKESETPAKKTAKKAPVQKKKQKTTPDAVEFSEAEKMTNIEKSGIVSLSGGNSRATGFIATIQDKYFIITNVHVLAAMDKPVATTMMGDEIPIGTVFTAQGHDIAIFPLKEMPQGCTPLKINESPVMAVNTKDKIIVCGNSEGRGTMLDTNGTLVALGPKLVELNCPFYEGNSGSPIFHIPTRTVIGVASHATISDPQSSSRLSKASRANEMSAIKSDTRYFGYRIDSVRKWERAHLPHLRKSIDILNEYKMKIMIMAENSSGRLTLDSTLYKEYADIIGAFKKEVSSISNLNGRRRAEKNMYDKLNRLCINETSKLKGLKVFSSFEDTRQSYIEAFESLALMYKNASENKVF